MNDIDNLPHYVYRYYDANDQALYVGCTYSVAKREAQHRRKAWFPLVARRVIDQYPNKFGGRLAEQSWIQREQPTYNQQRKYEPHAGDPLWFEINSLIAAEPHKMAEILARYEPAINDRINTETQRAQLEAKQWKRTQRRLRESRYRAALARKAS